jgi:hypothetical protein
VAPIIPNKLPVFRALPRPAPAPAAALAGPAGGLTGGQHLEAPAADGAMEHAGNNDDRFTESKFQWKLLKSLKNLLNLLASTIFCLVIKLQNNNLRFFLLFLLCCGLLNCCLMNP